MDDFDVKKSRSGDRRPAQRGKGASGRRRAGAAGERIAGDTLDAPQKAEEPGAPMTADDVNIDFEKFYDDAAGFPDEGIYTPPTAYEQSKSAYQVARRAEYDRVREARARRPGTASVIARDREEERMMRKLEGQRPQDGRKRSRIRRNPTRNTPSGSMSRAWSPRRKSTGSISVSVSRRSTEAKACQKSGAAMALVKAVLALVLILAIALGKRALLCGKAARSRDGTWRTQGRVRDDSDRGHRRGRRTGPIR